MARRVPIASQPAMSKSACVCTDVRQRGSLSFVCVCGFRGNRIDACATQQTHIIAWP